MNTSKIKNGAIPRASLSSGEFTYYIETRIEGVSLQVGYAPDDFILQVESQAILTDMASDDEFIVGELTANLLRARTAEEYQADPIEIADAEDGDIYDAARAVYLQGHGCDFKSKLLKLQVSRGDLLHFRFLTMDPEHRGVGLGLEMMQHTLDTVPHDLAMLFPRPLQCLYRDEETKARVRHLYGMFEHLTEKAASQKLRRYYARLGFQRIGKEGYMFRSPTLVNPWIAHDESRLKAQLAKVTWPERKEETSLIAKLHQAIDNKNWRDVEALARALRGEKGGPRRLPSNVADITEA